MDTTKKQGPLIFRQDAAPVTGLTYGKYPASYNACGVIATYNALNLKGYWGEENSFLRILQDFEALRYPRWKGLLGTRPANIGRYMKRRGIPATRWFRSGKKLDETAKPGTVIILSVWNHSCLFKGLHLFACIRTENGWKAYNRHYRSTALFYPTFDAIIEKDARQYLLVLW